MVAATAVATALLALPAAAVDEAQVTEVTCDGLRVTQRGLPAGLTVDVEVLETRTGRVLAEVDGRAGASGVLDMPVAAPLEGVVQIVVEVVSRPGHQEYGEAGADLTQPCSSGPGQPSRQSPAASIATGAASTGSPTGSPAAVGVPARAAADQGGTSSRVLVALLSLLLVLVATAGIRQRRRTGGS